MVQDRSGRWPDAPVVPDVASAARKLYPNCHTVIGRS